LLRQSLLAFAVKISIVILATNAGGGALILAAQRNAPEYSKSFLGYRVVALAGCIISPSQAEF
jgi:hypothetical protein